MVIKNLLAKVQDGKAEMENLYLIGAYPSNVSISICVNYIYTFIYLLNKCNHLQNSYYSLYFCSTIYYLCQYYLEWICQPVLVSQLFISSPWENEVGKSWHCFLYPESLATKNQTVQWYDDLGLGTSSLSHRGSATNSSLTIWVVLVCTIP